VEVLDTDKALQAPAGTEILEFKDNSDVEILDAGKAFKLQAPASIEILAFKEDSDVELLDASEASLGNSRGNPAAT